VEDPDVEKKAAERGDSFNVTGRRGTINEISRTAGVGLKKEVTASLILLGKSHSAWAIMGHEQRPSWSGARKVESRDAWKGTRKSTRGLPCSFTRQGHLKNHRVRSRD
jgi:hypothetical protein